MNKCKGLLGLLFGHKFVHNYNTKESFSPRINLDLTLHPYPEDLIESFKLTETTYINSVCSRCGCVRTWTSQNETP